MKDLILTKDDNTLVGTLRVDMLSNSPANITIFEMHDGAGLPVDTLDAVGGYFKRQQSSWATFLAFCTTNNLKITARDTNGENSATVLLNQVPVGTQYAIVSATAGTKTFLVATNVTADFTAGDALVVYNADNTIWQEFTHASDSYGAPNTSIVVTEAVTGGDIAVLSGKYIINNGQ